MGAKELHTAYKAYLRERRGREKIGTRLIEGTDSVLAKLKRSGFLLGIVSKAASGRILKALQLLHIHEYFGIAEIFGSSRCKAESIARAMKHFRSSAFATIYVGDRPDDQDAARKAGVAFVAVCTGTYGKRHFPASCAVLPSVRDLPDYLSL